jgi:hypothetical protein
MQGISHDQNFNALGFRGYDIRLGGMTTAGFAGFTKRSQKQGQSASTVMMASEFAAGNRSQNPVIRDAGSQSQTPGRKKCLKNFPIFSGQKISRSATPKLAC